MAVKLKQTKTVGIPVMAAHLLSSALPKLNTTCIADFRIINGVLTEIEEQVNAKRTAVAKAFFEQHKLKEDEIVDQNHKLNKAWMAEFTKVSIELQKDQLAPFTEDFIDTAIAGKQLTFDELRVINQFLIIH